MNHRTQFGFALCAAFLQETGHFVGLIGLLQTSFHAHFTPAVEIGWRLLPQYWGQGLAPEGARAALDYGFNTLELPEIVAFTTRQNRPSIRVMEKLGMRRCQSGDFEHPNLDEGHPLRPHVLYRICALDFASTHGTNHAG